MVAAGARLLGLAIFAGLGGSCVRSQSVVCGDVVCPEGNTCVAGMCATPDSLAACNGIADSGACVVDGVPGSCRSGVCIAASCGNTLVEPGESCDTEGPPQGCIEFGYDYGPLGCSSVCALAFDHCTRIGWQLVSAQYEQLRALAETPTGTRYAAGDAVARQVAGGTWQRVAMPETRLSLYDVLAVADDDVYAVGRNYAENTGRIFRFDGTSWTAWQLGNGAIIAVVRAAGVVYAVAGDTVYRYEAGAWTPTSIASQLGGAGVTDAWATPNGQLVLVGTNGLILRGSGSSFSPMPTTAPVTATLRAVWGRGDNDIYAVGNGSTVLHYNGSAWSDVPSAGVTADFGSVGGDAAHVYVSGMGPVAMGARPILLHLDGTAWTTEVISERSQVTNVMPISTGFLAVNFAGEILETNGSGWRRHHAAVWPTFPRALSVAAKTAWIGLEDGTVGALQLAPTLSGPPTWTTYAIDGAERVNALLAIDANDVYATTGSGKLFHFDGSWTSTTTGAQHPGFAVARAGDVTYIGSGGGLKWRVGAGAWQLASTPASAYAVWAASPTDVWVGGWFGIAHFDGATLSYPGIDTQVKTFDARSATDITAVGKFGAVLHYDGTQWTDKGASFLGPLRDVAGDVAIGRHADLRIFDRGVWTSMSLPAADIDGLGAIEQLDAKRYLIVGHKADGLVVYTLTLP